MGFSQLKSQRRMFISLCMLQISKFGVVPPPMLILNRFFSDPYPKDLVLFFYQVQGIQDGTKLFA
ncbi:hypothetical protein MKX03_008014, partial [Papaver bracteatum]